MATASVVSTSATASIAPRSPSSNSGVPGWTTASLSWRTRSTTPFTGQETSQASSGCPRRSWVRTRAARAASRSCRATSRPRSATSTSRALAGALGLDPLPRLLGDAPRRPELPGPGEVALRLVRSFRASASAASALRAASSAARARACTSERVRASRSGGATGTMRASVASGTQGSPARTEGRRSVPLSGEESTYRSRTRTRPSSSTVTRRGPNVTFSTSTETERGPQRQAERSPDHHHRRRHADDGSPLHDVTPASSGPRSGRACRCARSPPGC